MRLKALRLIMAITIAGAALWLARDGAAQAGTRIGQPAPEISGGPWINSEPLSMQKLKGRVVYVEFWTYG